MPRPPRLTRTGALLIAIAALVAVNTTLRLADTDLGVEVSLPARPDNIAGRAFPHPDAEPIDAVYTWVNGSDAEHRRLVAFWQALADVEEPGLTDGSAASSGAGSGAVPDQQQHDQSGASRFADHDELRYSIRSLERFAGWVRRVYIVTNGQVPTWLDTDHPRVTVVPHSAIFANASDLPTFSSPAIEVNLHRIPGLSRRFLYLNDDTFFGAPIVLDDFLSPTQGHRVYLSWPVPNCAEACPSSWLSDGYCDQLCNVSACDWDGGDCLLENAPAGQAPFDAPLSTDPFPERCSPQCSDRWLGDRFCDQGCNNAECGFDATDCGIDRLPELLTLNASAHRHSVPPGTKAVHVPLGAAFPPTGDRGSAGDGFRAATVDDDCWLRTAVISAPLRTFVGVAAHDASRRRAVCHVEIVGAVHGIERHLRLNITLLSAAVPITASPSAPPSAAPLAEPSAAPGAVSAPKGPAGIALETARRLQGLGVTPATDPRRLARQRRSVPSVERGLGSQRWRRALQATASSVSPLGRRAATEEVASTKRRLQDLFGDSLNYANKLVTRKYGNAARSVPAHMVHLIDRDVVAELWRTWPEEFAATSRSKFRSRSNVQYGFLHFYHIMSARSNWTEAAFFAEMLDNDGNGFLDDAELRRAGLLLWEKDVPVEDIEAAAREIPQPPPRARPGTREAKPSPPPPAGAADDAAFMSAVGEEHSHASAADASEASAGAGLLSQPAPAAGRTAVSVKVGSSDSDDQADETAAPDEGHDPHASMWSVPPTLSPEETVNPMPDAYLDAVRHLVAQAVAGVLVDDVLAPAVGGRLTAERFGRSHVARLLVDHYEHAAYRHQVMELDDVTFVMVRNNATVARAQMDHVLSKRPKFLCINDDMNHSHPEHPTVVAAVQDLLATYYPGPSSFELPPGLRNTGAPVEAPTPLPAPWTWLGAFAALVLCCVARLRR